MIKVPCDCQIYRAGKWIPCGRPSVENKELRGVPGMRMNFCFKHTDNHIETFEGVRDYNELV